MSNAYEHENSDSYEYGVFLAGWWNSEWQVLAVKVPCWRCEAEGEERSVKMAHTTRYDTGCAYSAYSGLHEID